MMGNRSKLKNFVEKFIGTVRFGNDHFRAIMGYGDYIIVIESTYCFVRDINGADLLKVFGALCYPTNDSEDLGKFQAKADIGIFVGYAYIARRAPLEFYKTRELVDNGKQVYVTFDEMHQQWPWLAPTDKELEMLFQPMFDEYLEQSRVNEPVPYATAIKRSSCSTSVHLCLQTCSKRTILINVHSSSTSICIIQSDIKNQPKVGTVHSSGMSLIQAEPNLVNQPPDTSQNDGPKRILLITSLANPLSIPKKFKMYRDRTLPRPIYVMVIRSQVIYNVKLDEYGDVPEKTKLGKLQRTDYPSGGRALDFEGIVCSKEKKCFVSLPVKDLRQQDNPTHGLSSEEGSLWAKAGTKGSV
ncbi:hypothetical protein Tco_0307338 [Tanacetum coccineum]